MHGIGTSSAGSLFGIGSLLVDTVAYSVVSLMRVCCSLNDSKTNISLTCLICCSLVKAAWYHFLLMDVSVAKLQL